LTRPVPPVLVVGEALADVVVEPDGRRHAHAGGSPANTALGLARLGRPVHLATRLGHDGHGRMIRDRLLDSGVHLTQGSLTDAPTSTAEATLDRRGKAHYTFDISWSLPPDITDPARLHPYAHLHTGSIAASLPPGGDQVRDLAHAGRGTATLSYDPNLRPALLGAPAGERPRVEALVTVSDLVKVSDDDLGWLYPDQDPERVAAAWARRGPALVVLTRGADGARAYWRTGCHDVPAAPVTVVDTIGAGDAFMSGLLSGLLTAGLLGGPDGRSALLDATGAHRPHPGLVDALDLAARVASITCGRPGADPPTRAHLTTVPA
jgi:fructokinase